MSSIDKASSSALRGSFAAEMMFPSLQEKDGYVLPGEVMHSEQKHEVWAV